MLPAWYFNEMVVVAPSFSLESELQIIDFDHDKQYGVIFDSKSKKLYRINAIGEMKFNNIFDSKGVLRFPINYLSMLIYTLSLLLSQCKNSGWLNAVNRRKCNYLSSNIIS